MLCGVLYQAVPLGTADPRSGMFLGNIPHDCIQLALSREFSRVLSSLLRHYRYVGVRNIKDVGFENDSASQTVPH